MRVISQHKHLVEVLRALDGQPVESLYDFPKIGVASYRSRIGKMKGEEVLSICSQWLLQHGFSPTIKHQHYVHEVERWKCHFLYMPSLTSPPFVVLYFTDLMP